MVKENLQNQFVDMSLPRLLVSWIKQPLRSYHHLSLELLRGEQPNLSLETENPGDGLVRGWGI